MRQNKYLPKQMNGILVNSYAQSLSDGLEKADYIADYLHDISIDTADDTELNSIGCLLGYPRPVSPEGFDSENTFLLGDIPIVQDTKIGLSAVGESFGGVLSTVSLSNTNYMDSDLYRRFLKNVAYIKRFGMTLKVISRIAGIFSKKYTITYSDNGDITIQYENPIGYRNVWILTQLFFRFAVEPQITIKAGV